MVDGIMSNVVGVGRGRLKRELNLVTLTAVMIGLNIGGVSVCTYRDCCRPHRPVAHCCPADIGITDFTCLSPLSDVDLGGAHDLCQLPVCQTVLPSPRCCRLVGALRGDSDWCAAPVCHRYCQAPPDFDTRSFRNRDGNHCDDPVFLLNVAGVKAAAYVQLGTVVLLLLALVTFIIPGIPAIEARNLTPMFTGGAMGLIAASAILYTLLAGGLFGIELGDEVKNARSTVPRALVISISIVMALYLLIELAAVGVIDWRAFAAGGTLGTPAEVFLSTPLLDFFIIGGGILAATTTINLTLTAAGRYVLVSAEDRLFPRFFSNINRRFGTPHWGLTLAYVLSVVTLLINPPLETLAAMLNFGLLFMVTLVLLAAFRLPKTHPGVYEDAKFKFGRKTLAVTSLAAVVINVFFMIILTVALPAAALIFATAGVIGLVIYFIRKRQTGFTPLNLILGE